MKSRTNYKIRENYPQFWHHLQIWGFPKSVWSFIFHWMEMTGLTTTVILTIMVYCKEKIQNKIRHGRKCIEQSPGELPRSEFPFSFPYEVRTWLSELTALSACSPLPLYIKALAPWLPVGWGGVGWRGKSQPLDRHIPFPTSAPGGSIKNKANFPFQQPGLFNGF